MGRSLPNSAFWAKLRKTVNTASPGMNNVSVRIFIRYAVILLRARFLLCVNRASGEFETLKHPIDATLRGQKYDVRAYIRHSRFFQDIIGNISKTTEAILIL